MNKGGRGLQSEVRGMRSHCLFLSQTQCILCDWKGWLLIICPSWLPSEEKMQCCSLTLEGQQSQEQLISTGKKGCEPVPSRFVSPCLQCTQLEKEMRRPPPYLFFFFFCSEKWKFESERWSKASKGTCN